jgi:diguanylate cyclase (GGDEF)-like protein
MTQPPPRPGTEPAPQAKHNRRSPLVRGSIVGLLLALAATGLDTSNLLVRWDWVIYDLMVRLYQRPAPPEPVIVAIDQRSLEALGRWPWPHRVHAQLLDRLITLGAGPVGFDILFSEPGNPASDQSLAAAMERYGRVVLAMAPEVDAQGRTLSEILPIPVLAQSAAAIGHTEFELDVDGICRSVYLQAGLGSAHWPVLGLALVRLARPGQEGAAVIAEPAPARKPGTGRAAWVRDLRLLIPYVGREGHMPRVSYVDVLRGRVDAATIRGRMVLVGSTAAGLGDALSVPGIDARTRMSGVEVNANVAAALAQGIGIVSLAALPSSLLAVTLVLTAVLALTLSQPRYAPLVLGLALTATLASALLLLWLWGLWWPPTAVVLVLILSYPLWSWHRLQAVTGTLRDLSRRVDAQESQDSLTGLPNRKRLDELMLQALERANRSGGAVGLILVGVQRLDAVNRELGYSAGDCLLQAAGRRLVDTVRDADLVCRLSGNEFAVLTRDTGAASEVEGLGRRLTQAMHRPFTLSRREVHLSCVLGAACFPAHAGDAPTLLRHAHTAMRREKEKGPGGLCMFAPGMEREANARLELEQDLRSALARSQMVLYYQPQVIATDGQLVGVEALVRWRHPRLGLLPPGAFIPLAESTGLIVPIGSWVMRQACQQLLQWQRQGLAQLRVAVNLSAAQLAREDIVDVLSGILRETGIAPGQLELELTESMLLSDLDAAGERLKRLKALGVGLSIDDFGTGYASLSYLQRLPFDRIKIDRSFIKEVGLGPTGSEIASSVIAMAHRLALKVVAEGVETESQREILAHYACDELQGFLIARPLPPQDLYAFWQAHRRP